MYVQQVASCCTCSPGPVFDNIITLLFHSSSGLMRLELSDFYLVSLWDQFSFYITELSYLSYNRGSPFPRSLVNLT